MHSLLEMIYEYQLLRSKERNLDIPLDESECARRAGLQRLLQGETPDGGNRGFVRVRVPVPCQFTRPGGVGAGELRDLGGGGFQIATARPPDAGTRVIVRLEVGLTEYVFPCTVRWVDARQGRMGVEIDGVPHRSDLFQDDSTGVRRLGRGAGHGEPMAA